MSRVAFAGNHASDGDILVLYDELFKAKMRQGDQLFGRGVAFSGSLRDTGNGIGIRKDRTVKVVQQRGQGRFNILKSYIMGTAWRANGIRGALRFALRL